MNRLSAVGAGIVAVIAMVASPALAVGRTALVPARIDQQGFPDAAFAAAKANPQPAPKDVASKRNAKVTESELRAAVDAWESASRLYKAATAKRAAAVVAIYETFTASVKRAKFEFEAIRAQVNTPSAKSAAAARFADAVRTASAVHQAELDALPPLPPAPGAKPTLKSLAALRQQASATPSPFAG